MMAWRRMKVHLQPVFIEDMDTLCIPITDPHIEIENIRIDSQSRFCLQLSDSYAGTLDLVIQACSQFYAGLGYFPEEIVLCPSRYVVYQGQSFSPNNTTAIPYVFEEYCNYDVLVRRSCSINGSLS